ncbi:hypothetical protein V4842_26410, partial [Pseudomonas moraviensis]
RNQLKSMEIMCYQVPSKHPYTPVFGHAPPQTRRSPSLSAPSFEGCHTVITTAADYMNSVKNCNGTMPVHNFIHKQ